MRADRQLGIMLVAPEARCSSVAIVKQIRNRRCRADVMSYAFNAVIMSPMPGNDLRGGFIVCISIIGIAHLNTMRQCRRKCLVRKVESVLNILNAGQHAYLDRCSPYDESLQSLQATFVSICPIVDQKNEHVWKPNGLHAVNHFIEFHRR